MTARASMVPEEVATLTPSPLQSIEETGVSSATGRSRPSCAMRVPKPSLEPPSDFQ